MEYLFYILFVAAVMLIWFFADALIVRPFNEKYPDPLHECAVYKEIGCAHVDGMLCQVEHCGTIKEYLSMGKETFLIMEEFRRYDLPSCPKCGQRPVVEVDHDEYSKPDKMMVRVLCPDEHLISPGSKDLHYEMSTWVAQVGVEDINRLNKLKAEGEIA